MHHAHLPVVQVFNLTLQVGPALQQVVVYARADVKHITDLVHIDHHLRDCWQELLELVGFDLRNLLVI